MATYASYKKVDGSQISDGALDDNMINPNTLNNFGVKWFFGQPCRCSPGCCCNWSVPSQVKRLSWELWGAGGNGAGSCASYRCHHFKGAAGGGYTAKSHATNPGCAYTVCAAGVYRCLSRECVGCNGCSSFVQGFGLTNSCVCACGGYRGEANTSWSTGCFGINNYCYAPGNSNSDMAIGGHDQGWSTASGYCHCHPQEIHQGMAPKIGGVSTQGLRECWIRCGCWSVPYGTGGQSAMNTYCGSNCCGQGGTGGGGLVRVTYI